MTYAAALPTRPPELGHAPIRPMRLVDIRPSPENDRLYRPVDPADPEIIRLAESLLQCGVQEPLLVARDGWIISGHRRYVAARLAGLETVPCRIAPISKDADHDAFMTLLRECNRQRVKSFDEKLREEAMAAAPFDAYEALLRHRQTHAQRAVGQVQSFEIVGTTSRARITKAKKPMLDAVRKVLADLREFHPVSARQIHYALLNDPPLRHASKPHSTYRNDGASYKSLLDLLTRARLAGLVPMHQVADETRSVSTWHVHGDVQSYIAEELEFFLQTYRRDLLASQPHHIELVAEKNTVAPIVMPVAREYCVPTTIGRGYCSLPPRAAMVRRYRHSGKDTFILLVVSDFDPDGEEIAHSLARSLRDDFGVVRIEPVKVALTAGQVAGFALPEGGKAKRTSRHYGKFAAQYGEGVFELEALLAERRRAMAESWDVLVALRKLLQERKELLRQLRAHVGGKVSALEEQRTQAFGKARSAISRANRSYLKANPVQGPAWLEAEAESDEAVVALREQISPLQAVLDRLASAYHRTSPSNALTFRQREVYEQFR